MSIYWFRVDDVRSRWFKLCSACADEHQLTGTREESTIGTCEACGWSDELDVLQEPTADYYAPLEAS